MGGKSDGGRTERARWLVRAPKSCLHLPHSLPLCVLLPLHSYIPLPVPTVSGTHDAQIPCLISVSVCAAHIRANPSFVLLPYIFACPWLLPIFFFSALSPYLCRCSGGLFGHTSTLLPSCDTPPFSVHLHSYFKVLHVLNHVNEFNIRLFCGIHTLSCSILLNRLSNLCCPANMNPALPRAPLPVSVVDESRCPELRSVKVLRSAIPFSFSLKSQAQPCLNLSSSPPSCT